MSSLLKQMREQEGFSDTERVIANYLLENFRDLGTLSTRQLASRTYTSSAAIVRFSQKLGFEGYTEFKVKFMAEMMQSISTPKERFISEKDTVPDVIDKVLLMGQNALKETYSLIEQADINRALHYLRQARHIGFYTMGDNLNLARMAAANFIMVGKYVSVQESMPLQFLEAYDAPKDHAAIIMSRTGENRLLIEIARRLALKGNPIICITAEAKSTLSTIADVTLQTATTNRMEEFGPRVFMMGATFILTVLYGVLLTRVDYKGAIERDNWLSHHLHY